MRKFIAAVIVLGLSAVCALGQSQSAPTLRIVSEDGNRLPAELVYGNTKVKPLRLRPGTNQPITIDDTDFFVQQHYVDFLSRFPDQGGFAFWQDKINRCTTPQCRELERINTSAAFFLSIEYQETGFLVYKMYQAAFGDIPGTPIPVRREEFMPDTRRIGQGVEVGIGDWLTRLNQNKAAFAQEFVARGRFTSQYPAGMSPAEFVAKLNTNAGGALDAAEQQALVAELTAGNNSTAARASVLRKVAEDADLSRLEKNSAFVLTQYFGYLKRNPDEPDFRGLPDPNYLGFNFWLGKLNEHNGDFVRAQMVKAFIDSIEYRTRF